MKRKKTLLILGAGGHGKSVAEAALLSKKWDGIVFADDLWPGVKQIFGFPILSNVNNIRQLHSIVDGAIAAVGNNLIRERWQTEIIKAKIPLVTIVHPKAYLSPSAKVGSGSVIMAQAMIGVDVTIGEGVIVNANSSVDHDSIVDDFAHLGVGVHIAGGVCVGSRVLLQAGCCAGFGVEIPDGESLPPGTAFSKG